MAMATLNASLLARKGSAQPTARAPRYLASVPADTRPKTLGSRPPARPEKKTKKKSMRLSATTDRELRLLAVRLGLSQQALMERAVEEYLDKAFAETECMCRRI